MAKASRALLRRIRTVQNTRRITKTMELVSASKLKRATDRVAAARPYAAALGEVMGELVTPELVEQFPLLRAPLPPSKGGPARAALLLATSNRGLCGAFNSNLIKEARRRIAELEAEGYAVDLYAIGKKGGAFFRYTGRTLAADRQDIGDKPTAAAASELARPLIEAYLRGELGRVEFVHAQYRSALSTPPVCTTVLPVPTPAQRGPRPDYILAPDAESLLRELVPLYVQNAIYRGLAETAAGEHGARRTAMKSATDNATDLMNLLRRTYNKQRQAGITQEISEIVGGAAALQG
ncbi:MAG: ATP synthase F1 subunit gamma [Gemmatimonadales bacterium]|jgi:F-type H+-transporting ATPase subunit gamma|nr:ATP synthase F1 subunit gamma [Gemmatimonadales bacterium]